MTQSLPINPGTVRERDLLQIEPIEINRYAGTVAEERGRYGDHRLVTLLESMTLIREVETMLFSIKRGDDYRGVAFHYGGPAHLSIGQEAAAAGQALALTRADHTFGSHRSHGEIIARGIEGIEQSPEDELEELMASYQSGRIAAAVEEQSRGRDVRSRARTFFLYGLVAEVFGRSTGFNLGVGGSMHAFFTPFGIYPNNAIVGGASSITAGSGLHRRIQRQPGISVANIGDGSTGCGVVWESMNFAAQEQFHTLFDEAHRGGLPVIFFFVNNFYAMGGQTIGETMGYERLSRIGAGVNPKNLHAETIDGTNPLAVADAVTRAREWIEAGDGPVLIDCNCYRYSGHSPSDASSYRTRDEIEAWRAFDPVPLFRDELVAEGVLDAAAAGRIEEEAGELVEQVVRLAADPEVSPTLSVPEIEQLTFSDVEDDGRDAPPGETLIPLEECPRVVQLGKRPRGSEDGAGGAIQLRDAIFEAIAERAVLDDRLVVYGEENRDWGGAFGVYRGLTELLPYRRLFNSPLSEAAIVGTAVGYAMEGGRALVELMYADFMGRAGDEIFNQLAKWTAMSGGMLRLPVVLRVSVGSAYGAQHSQDWSGARRAHPRPEGRLPRDAVRRQGTDDRRPRPGRPGRLLREPEALLHDRVPPAGGSSRRTPCRADRRAPHRAAGRQGHAADGGADPVPRARRGRRALRPSRRRGRGDRRAQHRAPEHGADPRVGEEDRARPGRVRRNPAGELDQHRRNRDPGGGVRLPRRAGRGRRRPGLHHAARPSRARLLPQRGAHRRGLARVRAPARGLRPLGPGPPARQRVTGRPMARRSAQRAAWRPR